jgi:hypothetical protein
LAKVSLKEDNVLHITNEDIQEWRIGYSTMKQYELTQEHYKKIKHKPKTLIVANK